MVLCPRFQHPPGVGQNIAWALTEELNISRIIDDLWYRDIRYSLYLHNGGSCNGCTTKQSL